jgi:hypothetical protein
MTRPICLYSLFAVVTVRYAALHPRFAYDVLAGATCSSMRLLIEKATRSYGK